MSGKLILTLASKYDKSNIRPFFESLYKTEFNGKCIVFGHKLNKNTVHYIKETGAEVIEYNENYPYIDDENYKVPNPKQYLSPNSLRYFLYFAYLNKYPNEYKYIIHTDIRDVYFQNDPFFQVNGEGIHFYLEHKSTLIKDSFHNSFWIKHGFGDRIYEDLKNHRISCSGVTIGTHCAWIEYLKLVINYLTQIKNTGGMDQGVHNYIIHKKLLNSFQIIEDDTENVSTISIAKPIESIILNKNNQVIGMYNQVIPIVHQYDRHWKLLWMWNRREYYKKKWDYIKQFLLAIRKTKKFKRKYLKNLRSILFNPMINNYDWS